MYVNVTFLAFQWGELKGFRGLGCCAGALFSDRPIMENPTITTLQLMFFLVIYLGSWVRLWDKILFWVASLYPVQESLCNYINKKVRTFDDIHRFCMFKSDMHGNAGWKAERLLVVLNYLNQFCAVGHLHFVCVQCAVASCHTCMTIPPKNKTWVEFFGSESAWGSFQGVCGGGLDVSMFVVRSRAANSDQCPKLRFPVLIGSIFAVTAARHGMFSWLRHIGSVSGFAVL
jgi:hypothetical protein